MARATPPAGWPGLGTAWHSGTWPRALLAGGVFLLLLAGLARLLMQPAVRPPLAPYLRLGDARGAAALQQALTAEFAPGTPLPPLVQRLEAMGLRCSAPAESAAPWACLARLRGSGRAMVEVQVLASAIDNRLAGVQTTITTATMP